MDTPADFLAYQQTIAMELKSIKDRVRSLIQHWPTDGTFKEETLRQILRRHLPSSLHIGTGFVIRNDGMRSSQIDILIVDRDHPTLFKDGDLLIVTPDAVRAAIEVKSRLSGPKKIREALDKLCRFKHLVKTDFTKKFVGLFVYDESRRQESNILNALGSAWHRHSTSVHNIAYGSNKYFAWHSQCPGILPAKAGFVHWSTPKLAPSYFVSDLIYRVSMGGDDEIWYPTGKTKAIEYYDLIDRAIVPYPE